MGRDSNYSVGESNFASGCLEVRRLTPSGVPSTAASDSSPRPDGRSHQGSSWFRRKIYVSRNADESNAVSNDCIIMPHHSRATLRTFFVFNPTLGRGEDEEHKKLLYFYPSGISMDDQLRDIGIVQGLNNFTKMFTLNMPCEVLHTQKTRQVFLEAEPDYWFVLTVQLPFQQRTNDSHTVVEYLAEDVQDSVLQAVLRRLYVLFRTFEAQLVEIAAKCGIDGLRKVLESHFRAILPRLNIPYADILDIFQGMQFLPLDRSAFLQVYSFIGSLQKSFPEVRYTAFLCNDRLVWSGLAQNDMQLLYHYLLGSVLQSVFEAEVLAPTLASSKMPSSVSCNAGVPQARFIHGKIDDPKFLDETPHMYIDGVYYSLLIYRALSATVCLLINSSCVDLPLLKRMDALLACDLTALANDISKQYVKLSVSVNRVSQDDICKYIYFNWMNIAQKSSVHAERKLGFSVRSSLIRLITDLHSDLVMINPKATSESCAEAPLDGEMIAKTSEDWWVVAKSWDHREFFVVLNCKNANLIQVSDEVKKLCNTQLQNILFID